MAKKKTKKPPVSATLLVELLTEELPPRSVRNLGEVFADRILNGLVHRQLKLRVPKTVRFATPRRLGVLIPDVLSRAADRSASTRLMPAKVAFDANGNATVPLQKRLEKEGLTLETASPKLERRSEDGTEYVYINLTIPGLVLDNVLSKVVEEAIAKLPIPNVMRWGTGDAKFVRPVHGLLMMHGSRIVPGEILGVRSNNRTLGHRFLSTSPIALKRARDYESALRTKGKVIANFDERYKEIVRSIKGLERKLKIRAISGGDLTDFPGSASLGNVAACTQALRIARDELLPEVTALVEFPVVHVGDFDSKFLELPVECLTLSMRQHQRYFPCFDRNAQLVSKFLFVSNLETLDPRQIVHGNERVLRARLADAKFFYDQDRKTRLEARVPRLANVVYHNKLGSQLERVERIKSISRKITQAFDTNTQFVERAARLSKADLITDMVGEFPELQGVMGRYYALHDGESIEVANAIEQHYWPRFAGDQLPESLTSCALALADRLYAIAGIFAAGQPPTGDKDPFALRRQALGVIRILIERKLDIRLQSLVDLAIAELPNNLQIDWALVLEFLLDRARSYFLDQGFAKQAIEAVIQPFGASSSLYTLPEIVAEASRFISTEEGRILAEANKRITNILKKSGFEVPFGLRPDQLIEKPKSTLFKEKAEEDFWNALLKIGGESVDLRNQRRFAESLRVLSQLGKPTKSFFDGVMVNVDEPDIRDNRITLLQHARAYMNQVAELSLMAI